MPLHRWLSRTTAWIATLAVCFGALAPTLSQAALKAHGEGAGHWVQICSASGITWVRADAADAGGEHPGATFTCPWGVITGGAAGLPPAHALVLPDAEPQPVPMARAQRDLANPIRLHAPARAPPTGT